MQLTDAQKRLFAALATNREFNEWLDAQEAATLKVLKRNTEPPVLHQAQGSLQTIDSLRAVCEHSAGKKTQP